MNKTLHRWYQEHKRDLPWRMTTDPYRIWLSEIILQQTRVAQGLEYYLRFVERFPTVETLAAASETEVLHLWQGLGYYSRARNLHAAAKMVVEKWGVRFPQTYKDLLSLKGVGEYTAAAIASFAFNLPYAVVDGNVERVLSRLFAIDIPTDSSKGKQVIRKLADEFLDTDTPAIHNQAMMEFGALQCTPGKPECVKCPLQPNCLAYEKGVVELLPRKEGKTKVRTRYFSYFYIHNQTDTIIEQRTSSDIWRNLYQFPVVETEEESVLEQLTDNELFKQLTNGVSTPEIRLVSDGWKHILSHQVIRAALYEIRLKRLPAMQHPFVQTPINELERFPFYRLMTRMLEKLGLVCINKGN